MFLNLATAESLFHIPPSRRLRINREKLRKLLLDGIEVQWNKSLTKFSTSPSCVGVRFQDGSLVEGKLLIGADGANSKLRRLLCPETGASNQLPIRCLGGTIKLSPEAIKPLRSLDPLLFQGCHPDTSTNLWYSVLDTPEANGSKGEEE
ncbi:putative FAD-dependent monooxygenase [Lachnellula suecica]|uniref:Putative FAD-dependent monooxygenase n=1 Tax=Lachnellula suecica TaxID=602035 RepID=A0A8T9BWD2_9HELO|nr:putative FAD-dependent monooxygenase [Lachnellula suecica]